MMIKPKITAFAAPDFKSSEIVGNTVCEPCLYLLSNSEKVTDSGIKGFKPVYNLFSTRESILFPLSVIL